VTPGSADEIRRQLRDISQLRDALTGLPPDPGQPDGWDAMTEPPALIAI
jgi:hypothetical protein